jgi:methylase of polypeptide subunit release factors
MASTIEAPSSASELQLGEQLLSSHHAKVTIPIVTTEGKLNICLKQVNAAIDGRVWSAGNPIFLNYSPVFTFDAIVSRIGLVLIEYLSNHRELITGKRVLELGSGTGAVGIACALLGTNHRRFFHF